MEQHVKSQLGFDEIDFYSSITLPNIFIDFVLFPYGFQFSHKFPDIFHF